MLSSAHSVSTPSRPRPPGSGRKSKTFPAHPATASSAALLSPHLPSAVASGIVKPDLPADALATSIPSRASTMPAAADTSSSSSSSVSGSQRTLQPSRSRLLNVFGTDGASSMITAAAQWSDESRSSTPKPSWPKSTALATPTTDEQFSALINVALANMASRSSGDATPPSKIVAELGGEGIDADHIGGLSREELEQLLVAANRKIMERERDIAIAAQIGRTLVEKHDSIKSKHDHILRALVTSNPRGGIALGEDDIDMRPPRYTPPSNDSTDYFGNQQQATTSSSSSCAESSFERRSTDSASSSSRLSHRKSLGTAASVYMQQQLEELEVRNDDLYVEVEALRTKAEQNKRQDSERLRNIQREMEALKAELSMAYTRNAELEEVARKEDERKQLYGTDAWKKRVHGPTASQRKSQEWWKDATAQPSPIKILVQRSYNGHDDSNELTNDDSLGDMSWNSAHSMARHGDGDEDDDGAQDENPAGERDDDDDDDGNPHHQRNTGDLGADMSTVSQQQQDDHERALVAQLLAKVRELEEANAAISARAKEFGDRAGRAFEQGERIKDGYEAVESASRMELDDENEEGEVDGQQGLEEGSAAAATRGGRGGAGAGEGLTMGDTSLSMKGDSPSSNHHALLLRRRAPGNRYAIEGRRTVRSAIRREKAALAELLAQASTPGGGESVVTPSAQTLAQPQTVMRTMANSVSINSISSFDSSLGSLRASGSESSFMHPHHSGSGNNSVQGGSSQRSSPNVLKTRKSALMLSRPKIRITPSCEDMAAAREEEARQKQGGWEDEPMRAGAEDESMDVLPPLVGGGMGMPSSRSLRRIASDGSLLGNGSDDAGSFTTSRRRSSVTSSRRRSREQQADADQMTPSSSFDALAFMPSHASLDSELSGLNALTLGSELGGSDGSPLGSQRLAVQPSGSSIASSAPTTPLKYRRPRRTQSSATLSVNSGAMDDEDGLSDIAELRFSVHGSPGSELAMDTFGLTPSPSRVDFSQELTVMNGNLEQKLQLDASPASDGVWRGEEPIVPRGALRDGEMTQYAAYDLLERAADHHPVSWADDEDFGRPITEGEARRLNLLLDDGRARAGGPARSKGLLSWLQPIPKRQKRNAGALQQGPSGMMEIESREQIEERRQTSEMLRHKRLAALQRSAAAKRGSGYDLSPRSHHLQESRFGGGGNDADGEEEDEEDEEEDELEARALAFSPSRQRRVQRLSLHGLPPSGEELLVPGGIRKRRSNSKLREVPDSLRQGEREVYRSGLGPGASPSSSARPHLHRKLSMSAYSDTSSQGGGGRGHGGGDDEFGDMPGSLRRRTRSVEMYGQHGASMVQQRVKVASNEVVTLISTWALFATVTVFAFVVAFSRGPRRVLGTPSDMVAQPRRNA
ncbi:unnamed protein product [Tilletia controversa]|nr:unnamed protein product [Tilletia controversa]CAD6980832.1 unnamed protein product [Tilletia controversa]CAD6982981.1 unnamed protein product [Tilletia controversa]